MLSLCMAAVDQTEMTGAVADDCDMFMNSSMNESPYFVHEPSGSSGAKKSAKVSHAAATISLCYFVMCAFRFGILMAIPYLDLFYSLNRKQSCRRQKTITVNIWNEL